MMVVVMMMMMMIGDIGVKVTVVNEIPPRAIEVPKKENSHLLSCQSHTLGAQLGATRRAPSTSHKEQPLCAALAPRSVALSSQHLINGTGYVRGVSLTNRIPGLTNRIPGDLHFLVP